MHLLGVGARLVQAGGDQAGVPPGVLARPVAVDGLALFVEREPGAPFTIQSFHALGVRRNRKTA